MFEIFSKILKFSCHCNVRAPTFFVLILSTQTLRLIVDRIFLDVNDIFVKAQKQCTAANELVECNSKVERKIRLEHGLVEVSSSIRSRDAPGRGEFIRKVSRGFVPS